jgi:hypothetical protein
LSAAWLMCAKCAGTADTAVGIDILQPSQLLVNAHGGPRQA